MKKYNVVSEVEQLVQHVCLRSTSSTLSKIIIKPSCLNVTQTIDSIDQHVAVQQAFDDWSHSKNTVFLNDLQAE